MSYHLHHFGHRSRQTHSGYAGCGDRNGTPSSLELNQKKIGKTYKTLIDRKESGFFIGRTAYDSPEVDNEVLIDAKKNYLRIGDFADILITEAREFDLHGVPAKTID